MTSKKLTVKRFVAIVVLTVLGSLGLFGVMLLTLILTQSGIAVLIAMFVYAAIFMILCTIPSLIKKWRPQCMHANRIQLTICACA